MAISQEYPDLQFVVPAAYGTGRDGHQVQYIVIHHTAGSERATSAEDGAAYDARRTDGTSTHYFCDQNSCVQCVYTWNRANAAFYYGNRKGIQYELCGTLQTRAQWLDAASDATLTVAARQIARDCKKYGIPAVKIGPAEMKAGRKGICGHWDVTLAYGLGDHTDPGPNFPWDILIERVRNFMGGGATASLGDEETMFLATFGTNEAVLLISGMQATWVETPDHLRDLMSLKTDGLLDIRLKAGAPQGIYKLSESQRYLIREITGKIPPGYEAYAPKVDADVTITAEDRGAIADEIKRDMEPMLRRVVDEQLDQQSRGGADDDTP